MSVSLLEYQHQYPDAPRKDTVQAGLEYQDFICCCLAKQHIILQNFSSKKYQHELGENLQGFEIKYDEGCVKFGHLSIEVAERMTAQDSWIPSGLCRSDNAWLYIQGNYSKIFIFPKLRLWNWYRKNQPKETDKPTIKTFYLEFNIASWLAVKTINL